MVLSSFHWKLALHAHLAVSELFKDPVEPGAAQASVHKPVPEVQLQLASQVHLVLSVDGVDVSRASPPGIVLQLVLWHRLMVGSSFHAWFGLQLHTVLFRVLEAPRVLQFSVQVPATESYT